MQQTTIVGGGIAPLTNVMLAMEALESAIDRPSHLPGMASLSGPSGFGKTFACTFAANKYRAIYVECKSSWTKKALLEAILKQIGIEPQKTLARMTDQVAEELVLSGKPLIIDEMDHIVEKKAVEIVRDIYEGSKAPILLIGEEQMPNKLKKWERFHGRIMNWVLAQPVSVDDVETLHQFYCPAVTVEDDLLQEVYRVASGSVRRVCVNLERIQQFAYSHGLKIIDLNAWGNNGFFTGEAPRRV